MLSWRKKKEIRKLWRTAFGDSESFIRLYFKWVYKDENALVIEHKGKVVSSLQLIPYTMNYFGEEIPLAYISGACTHEKERGKGWMSQLMLEAFEEMKRRGIALAALIPANKPLFGYYSKHGFTEAFEYSRTLYTQPEYILPKQDYLFLPVEKPTASAYEYFERKLKERPAGVLHDYGDMVNICRDMELSGGAIFAAFRPITLEPCGLAFAVPADASAPHPDRYLLVKELFYDDEDTKNALLHEVTRSFNVKQAVYRQPCLPGQPCYPYGMARVMDIPRMVGIWLAAHPNSNYTKGELLDMEAGALASLLLGYPNRTAYMSLMLD
ncbi:acetyltransferase [Bacteroidia bacterium]|nr:acetyltransferase [Bacteroidia bacterium]